jgi:hypothetical protein
VTRHRCRRFLFLSLGAVLVGFAAGAWLLWPRPFITRGNAAKIEKGMTLGEVQALLGGPERIETTGPTEGDADDDAADAPDGERRATERFLIALTHAAQSSRARIDGAKRTWGSDRVAIFVVFDADQRVIDLAVRPLRRAPESLADMLRRWLHL